MSGSPDEGTLTNDEPLKPAGLEGLLLRRRRDRPHHRRPHRADALRADEEDHRRGDDQRREASIDLESDTATAHSTLMPRRQH